MKKLSILGLAILVLMACSGKNEPSQQSSVNFTYQQTAPFTYSFTNQSKGMTSYKWDFGDGAYATTKDATHKYESAGTYTVTLTGAANGQKYSCNKKITVKKPAICIAGCKLYKIPYENKYYKIKCEDDDWFTVSWGFTTQYTPLLDKSDLPYTINFSPLEMTNLDGDNYYTFYVYYTSNKSNTSGDTQCLKQQLQKTEIYKYLDEHILTSDNGQTKLGILMTYK